MKYLISCAILLTCLGVAHWLSWLIGSQFPAPLLGMIILLILLVTGVVKEHHLKPSAQPLLNYMPVFFIPAGVAIVEHIPVITRYWPLLLTVFILVPLTSLVLVASFIEKMKKDKK